MSSNDSTTPVKRGDVVQHQTTNTKKGYSTTDIPTAVLLKQQKGTINVITSMFTGKGKRIPVKRQWEEIY